MNIMRVDIVIMSPVNVIATLEIDDRLGHYSSGVIMVLQR